MSIVYVLTSGTYSDYGIEAIFSTKALAEEAKKIFTKQQSYNESRIEEYEIFEEVPKPYTVYIIEKIEQKVNSRTLIELGWTKNQHFMGRIRNGVGFGKWTVGKRLCYRAWGTDIEAVKKRFYDFHNHQIEKNASM